jgi:hypothetical protein
MARRRARSEVVAKLFMLERYSEWLEWRVA